MNDMEQKFNIAKEKWKEYSDAIDKYKLDDIKGDSWHQGDGHKPYMHDAFFAGFYAAMEYVENIKND